MQTAVGALRDEGATVAELADRFGYRSEAAFSRVVGVVRRGRTAELSAPAS